MVVSIEQIFIAGSAIVAISVAFQMVRGRAGKNEEHLEEMKEKIDKLCDAVVGLEKELIRVDSKGSLNMKG